MKIQINRVYQLNNDNKNQQNSDTQGNAKNDNESFENFLKKALTNEAECNIINISNERGGNKMNMGVWVAINSMNTNMMMMRRRQEEDRKRREEEERKRREKRRKEEKERNKNN